MILKFVSSSSLIRGPCIGFHIDSKYVRVRSVLAFGAIAAGAVEFAQGTVYTYVNRLVDAGVVEVTHDEQPRQYAAREIDLTVTAAAGNREYTITPALIDTVSQRETNDDTDTYYIDRHGIAGR